MRVSSRLLVPALTILSWSIESTYASFHFPGQGVYKRQVRAADYSTSTGHPYDSNTGVKSPASDPSPPPRSGLDAAPQKSTKARRSTHVTKTQLSGSTYRSKKRNYDNEATSAIKSISHHKRQHSNAGKLPDVKSSKRTIPAAQHKSGNHDYETRGDLDRRSSIDLNTLHIARGIEKRQPQGVVVDSTPQTVGELQPVSDLKPSLVDRQSWHGFGSTSLNHLPKR